MKPNLEIRYAHTAEEAIALQKEGYEPIECCFGDQSVVGPLVMDHHGKHSHLLGVAVRSYQTHYGNCRESPRFVTCGGADEDACFAIAALAGELPHPRRILEFANASAEVRSTMTRYLLPLAELINQADTEPIGLNLADTEDGQLILLWHQMCSSHHDAAAFYSGVDRWRLLTEQPPNALLAAVKKQEELRVQLANQASAERISTIVTCVWAVTDDFGFDVWYSRYGPCILARKPSGRVSIGVRDKKTAEQLFRPGGLQNVYHCLAPSGWGGREAIGGSPRGAALTREQTLAAGLTVASKVVGNMVV